MVIMCEEASAFQDFIESGQGAGLTAPEDRSGGYHGLTVPAVDYLKALRIRTEGAAAMCELLAEAMMLCSPRPIRCHRRPRTATSRRILRNTGKSLSGMGNLLGLPSISIPVGLDEDALPTSLEILGAWWAEPTILAIATAFQAQTDWHTARPPLFG